MKTVVIGICVALSAGLIFSFFNKYIAPLIFDSRIERLHEKGLPVARVENGSTVYCRMKADDFRLPLPPGSHALPPVITSGGMDWVDGSVEARFGSSNQITAVEYESWLSKKLQVGAAVNVAAVPGGLSIKFHYFGDK
jgi:hypothetical protein